MAVVEKVLRLLDALGLFIVTRFPFIELFMLLMATGERADKNPDAPTLSFKDTLRKEYVTVYVHGAVFFVCGTGMALDIKRRKCGFAAALHLVVYTVMTIMERKKFNSEYYIARIAARTAAVFVGYLFVAGGLADGRRGHEKISQALQVGRQILAFYLFCNAYMIWVSEEDRLAYIKNIPGGQTMLLLVVLFNVLCGLCIYGGYEAGYFGRLVAWQLVIVTVLVDANTRYWYKSASRVDFWHQVQHASRNAVVAGAMILLGRRRHW